MGTTQMETHANELLAALARLETSLETPIVPGELANWCQTARQECEEVDRLLRQQITAVHRDLLQQILREDPGLAARVDELRQADLRLLEQSEAVRASFERLCKAAAGMEPDEARLEGSPQEVVDEGLQFVLAVRKQETALTTWYVEAFERDRGVVD